MYTEPGSILPIDGRVFNTSLGTWTATVSKWPIPLADSTVLVYEVEFSGPSWRLLKLSVPKELAVEGRQQEAFEDIQRWLEGQNGDGELKSCFS